MTNVFYSTVHGTNARAFRQIMELFMPGGGLVADVTFKTGAFWAEIRRWKNAPLYRILASDLADLKRIDVRADLRRLPYRDGVLDAVVLDPPYGNGSTSPRRDRLQKTYNLQSARTPREILQLYLDGITEALRVLKPRGLLIVKHQDMVNGGKQQWRSITIFQHALALGFRGEDRVTVIPKQKPVLRHPDRLQRHSRKWGSDFWVFRKGAQRKHAGKPASCKKPVPRRPSGKNSQQCSLPLGQTQADRGPH